MSCPNSMGILLTTFHLSPERRRLFFYGVCVPSRLAVAYLLYLFPGLVVLARVFAALSLVKLGNDLRNDLSNPNQWWSKKAQMFTSVLVLFANVRLVPWLAAFDVLIGVVQALYHGFC
jgi:hypothetical protein